MLFIPELDIREDDPLLDNIERHPFTDPDLEFSTVLITHFLLVRPIMASPV